jgi:hypothetical protein
MVNAPLPKNSTALAVENVAPSCLPLDDMSFDDVYDIADDVNP